MEDIELKSIDINEFKEKIYPYYLAIFPQYRDKKFGSKAVKLLLEKEKDCYGIFVEAEKVGLGKNEEENIIREKRKHFYERLGFKELNFDLLFFDVIYTPYLFSNIDNDDDIVFNEILKIYEEISGKERIKKNCKIIKK